jgi:hypothetical protein
VLILRMPLCRWSLPLVGEEEDDGCGGGALGASLWVALLSVLSRSGWNKEWNDLSKIVPP